MKSLRRDIQEYQTQHQLMASFGIYLIMRFFILQNHKKIRVVLKRTSIDGEDQVGKATAKRLQDNFYVDDLLK